MNIAIIGLGYIGLPTAAVLASRGINVTGVDINKEVVEIVNSGKTHIVELNLDSIVRESVKNGYLHATTVVAQADVFIIAVPTPLTGEYKPDISYIESSVDSISPVLKKGDIIILESTSPVGTTEKILKIFRLNRPDLRFPDYGSKDEDFDISIAYCPERILPGNALIELVKNDRVIGGISKRCAINAGKVYDLFVDGKCIMTDSRTAELCKLVENSYRDVNIAFANELSMISDKFDINVWNLIALANHHPRVNILQPGPGVGGHCISVDPWFIVDSAPDESKLIHTARIVNDSKPGYVLNQIDDLINQTDKGVQDLNLTCLGIAFKPDIDDLRESPALDIASSLANYKFNKLYIVEPNVANLPGKLKDVSILTDLQTGISEADIIVILVDHKEFKSINNIETTGKYIVDTKGIVDSYE